MLAEWWSLVAPCLRVATGSCLRDRTRAAERCLADGVQGWLRAVPVRSTCSYAPSDDNDGWGG